MKFSIITINYNNCLGLQKTIQSVVNQSFDDFQYIIIDGDSNDGSKALLNSLKLLNGNILSEKDGGIYDAMNKGLDLIKGEFVIFLNSGDSFASNDVLEKIYNLVKESKNVIDFIYGDAYEYNPINNKMFFKKARNDSKIWYGMFAHHQSMVYSKRVIDNTKLRYDLIYKLSSDWDFTIRFLKNCSNKIKVDFPISVFEQGGFSDNFMIGISEQYKIRRKALGFSIFNCLILYSLHTFLNFSRKSAPFLYHNIRLKEVDRLQIF